MRHRLVVYAAAVLAATLLPAASPADDAFVLVVNQKNPKDRMTRAEVSQLFLRRVRTWPNGVAVVPCDLSATHPARAAFSLEVHRKPAWYVVAFWQQEISSGRSQPPTVYAEEQAALAAVREDPGAIAYVSDKAALGPGLKRLALEP